MTRNKAIGKKIFAHSQAAASRCFRGNIPSPGDAGRERDCRLGSFIHQRFGQGAIAEEFVDGRELYVSMIGNDDALHVLPITEMVFDKRRSEPEERIATQFAKWGRVVPGEKRDPKSCRDQ